MGRRRVENVANNFCVTWQLNQDGILIFLSSNPRNQRSVRSSLHEKLTSIRVFATISHAQEKRFIVSQCEVFIVESVAIDRLSSRAIAVDEIARLDHKAFDNTMKHNSLKSR